MTMPAVTDLSCMSPDNMAAIALQMKKTALEAEERIFSIEARLRAALNRPTIIQQSTLAITGLLPEPLSGEQYIGPQGGGAFTTLFNNTGVNTNVDSSARTMFAPTRLGPGQYEVGICARLIASGAVTDNSYRTLRVVVGRPDPTAVTGEVYAQETSMTLYEPNNGNGVDMNVTCEFVVEQFDWVKFLLYHNNASNLDSSASAIVWLTKISSDDPVVVV